MHIELDPVHDNSHSYYDRIEARIKSLFIKYLYKPLLAELKIISSNKVLNAKDDDLDWALKSGQVTYSRGAFRGKFNATITKELKKLGAKWDQKTSSFKIPKAELPHFIKINISTTQVAFEEKIKSITRKLEQLLPESIAKELKTKDILDSAMFKVEKSFRKNIAKIAVPPTVSDETRAKIADLYQNNMHLWIKDFTEKQIKELRETVKQSYFAGNRYESLIKGIKSSYNVTEHKAKFLARQETHILLATYNESRYMSAGVNQYKWGCVKMPHDQTPNQHTPGNVRYQHGQLEGKIFRFDDPPIDSDPGKIETRNNPGKSYNCRCFPIPLVKF